MRRTTLTAVACSLVLGVLVAPSPASADRDHDDDRGRHDDDRRDTLVVGHRGASGYRPEHTLGAYELAIRQCADFIEPDLVSTRDGVLVARHENEIGGTTDVAAHPEFAARRTTKTIDGAAITGWFTEDFTFAELQTLRAKERIPAVRPANTAYDGRYGIPSLQEVVDLARRSRTCDGKPVGLYPETKHPSYFDGIGLSMEEGLVRTLHRNGYRGDDAPVFLQSFEVGNLRDLDRLTDLPIAQLVNCSGRPWDFTAAGDTRTYADLVTPTGLRSVERYADGIGACKDVLIPRDAAGNLAAPTPVLRDAHRRGLEVHGWTFRRENQFLPLQFRKGTDPNAPGDLVGEIRTFVAAGMDGFFTDNPDLGVAATSDVRLLERSVLPAATYRPGSAPSGHFTGTTAPIAAPYPGQPVQGFSGVHRNRDGSYQVMSDNGFGNKANSPDFELRVHRIRPNFETGVTRVLEGGFTLTDPHRRVPWATWRDGGCAAAATLPAGYTCPAPDRVLTGWDFDLEAMQIAPDGTYWFGDEFGPFLLHTDDRGRLLQAPVPTPGVRSPSDPTLPPGTTPNLANSKGFEGMALSPDGRTLYPMLEGPVAEDTAAGRTSDLRIFEVDLGRRGARYTGDVWRYRLDDPSHAIGDLIAVNDHQFLVIERDNGAGPTARAKAVYLIDLDDRNRDGYVDKQLLVDLMAIPDPEDVGGLGDPFTFPFVTIEDVEIVDRQTIAVLNDNNFPGAGGRAAGVPDDNELILIRLDRKLDVSSRLL